MRMSIARVIFALGGTTAYLALAVLGWGGMSAFFSHPALVALTVAVFATAVASLFVAGT